MTTQREAAHTERFLEELERRLEPMKTIYYDPDKNRFFRVISKNQFFANCGGYARSYSDAHTTRSVMSVDRRYLHGCKVVVDVADFADYDPVIDAWFVRDR